MRLIEPVHGQLDPPESDFSKEIRCTTTITIEESDAQPVSIGATNESYGYQPSGEPQPSAVSIHTSLDNKITD